MSAANSKAIFWLRRDLRIHDNPALHVALKSGATEAIFISTPKQWHDHHLAPIQADFIQRHLVALAQELLEIGVKLIHLTATDYDAQRETLSRYCLQHSISTVFANREPEINEIERDSKLQHAPFELKLFSCDTILPVGSVLNKQGQMFKVFTPFKNAWLKRLQLTGIGLVQTLSDSHHKRAAMEKRTDNGTPIEFDYPTRDSSQWPLASQVMQHVVPQFLETKLDDYALKRDYPGIKGTSGLSPYLAIGAISPRLLAIQLVQHQPNILSDTSAKGFAWFNELIWRDFYKHLLFHFPNLAKGDCFQARYQHIAWQHNHAHFVAWCEGRTGYPLVDAAMKQLVNTGWMHNRLRMVVASFLTKHLLVDWRLGERFFMSQLIDGDLSANNGGWQWAASTGCDAQPYFRVFNPILQSKKFDPNGEFIRKYLPELKNVPDKHIHFPHVYLELHENRDLYCAPIVDHKDARQRAIELFKQHNLNTS
ncbi:deoxyribodipyrimidine photo-lyase [Vibrio makurazakiensis]|uniref:deoxyribodipyrimidine photo-lyase n=1 Tax=Vibrio makurazakiensis TaxID=2910250 RepID=UPI003D0ACE6E